MAFSFGAPPSRLDDEMDELRAAWSGRSHQDTIKELEVVTRALRKAEEEGREERRKSDAAKKEFLRLREVEKLYRAEVGERKYTNRVEDVNANLRRLVGGGGAAEDVINRLHAEIEDKDTMINILQDEVDQLRKLQKQVLDVSTGGMAGELLAARQHAEHLTSRIEKLTTLNDSLQQDILTLFSKLSAPKAPLQSNISRFLCPSCKPKTIVWYDDVVRSWKQLHAQLEDAQTVIRHLTSTSTHEPPVSPTQDTIRTQRIVPNPASSRKWSPAARKSPPTPTVPFGIRSVQSL